MALFLLAAQHVLSTCRVRVAILCAITGLCLQTASPTAEEQGVTWTEVVNATVSGTILQKTGGLDGVADAGAVSMQDISAGDGYVEFAVGEIGTIWFAGLNHDGAGTSWEEIDFAFRFNGGGTADVMENGTYRSGGDTSYAPGDRFRVSVANGRVRYSKNGMFLTESTAPVEYPLKLDVSLLGISSGRLTSAATAWTRCS